MRSAILFYILLSCSTVFSETGIPLITNYSPKTYNAHGQNWQVTQGPNGVFYFANTDGVLSYNGVSWKLISLPKYVITRSLAVDASDIYVGAQDELGVLRADSLGHLLYHSLKPLLPDSIKNVGNVWQVHVKDDFVYFLTRPFLLQFDKSKGIFTRVHTSKELFHSLHKADNKLYVQHKGAGFSEFLKDRLQVLPGSEIIRENNVYSVISIQENALLIGTRKAGLFIYKNGQCRRFKTEIDDWLQENKLYHAVLLADSTLALGTLRGGIANIDKNGRLLSFIDKAIGLQDNTVWHLFADEENNLWVALNKGISKMYWPVPFSQFDERNGLTGNVQSVVRFKGRIYAATGYGVFYLENERGRAEFKRVEGIDTQCWHLDIIRDRLFVANNSGIWEIDSSVAVHHARYNTWRMMQWKVDSSVVFIGLDDGIAALRFNSNGGFSDLGRIPGISEEARTMVQDSSGALWIGTTRQGVLRVQLDPESLKAAAIQKYNSDNGLPSMDFNLVYQAKNDAILTTSQGLFKYNHKADTLLALEAYNRHLPKSRKGAAFYTAAQNKNGDLWINSGLKPALLRNTSSGNIEIEWQKFLAFPEMLIYTIYSDGDIVWFGGPGGLIRHDTKMSYNPLKPFAAHISTVKVPHDSIGLGPLFDNEAKVPKISHDNNSLRFEYYASSFVHEKANQFRYKLEGFDEQWSGWTDETQRDYTNLFEGSYTFRVEAKNVFNVTSSQASFSLDILPPWYRTGWAYAGYLLFFMLLFTGITKTLTYRARQKALQEQQKIEQIKKSTEEQLRKQMAADFHDELGNKITRISLFSELIRQTKGTLPQDVVNYVSKISENANTLYSETRDFIWQLDPQKDALIDTIVRLKNFGDELFDATGTEFEMKNNLNAYQDLKLDMELRRNIIRILKEAMHNAMKHAVASKVVLTIYNESGKILFEVSDNGRGFKEKSVTGNGLNNMRQRADRINADIEINVGQNGTCVRLAVPARLGS